MPAPISVVLPAHNARRFVGEAIASVYGQTLPVSELIVVDDGSTDDTAKEAESVVKRLKQRGRDLKIRVRRQDQRGVSSARNAGIQETSGGWIAFLDADDVWRRDKIEHQWKMILRYPKAGMVACDHTPFRDRCGTLSPASAPSKSRRSPERNSRRSTTLGRLVPSIGRDFFASGLVLLPSTVIVRREAFDAAGLFNESLHAVEDFECFMRILARYPLAVVDRSLVRYRLHDRNIHFNQALMESSFLQYVELVKANPQDYPGAALQAALGEWAARSGP